MKRIVMLLILVLLFIGVSAVNAQEGLTVVVPPVEDDGGMSPLYIVGMVVLVIASFVFAAFMSVTQRAIHLEAIDLLHKSTPSLVRQPAYEFVAGTGDNILAEIDKIATATTFTDLDDRAQEQAAALWQEMKARWAQLQGASEFRVQTIEDAKPKG
jgi:hypothetical protein